MSCLRNAIVIAGVSLLLVGLTACGGLSGPPPTQTPIYVTATPTPIPPTDTPTSTPVATATNVPTKAPAATSAPTRAPASALKTYSNAPGQYSIQYPGDWQVKSEDPLVVIAPDSGSELVVIFVKDVGNRTPDQLLTGFIAGYKKPNIKTGNQRTNPDGSASIDIQFDEVGNNIPMQGEVRMLKPPSSTTAYLIQVTTRPEQFLQFQPSLASIFNSFQVTSVAVTPVAAQAQTYTGTYVNYTIQYFANWAVKPQEGPTHGSVTFSGPGGSGFLLTWDPNRNKFSSELIRDNYLVAFGVPNLKSSNKHLNADGSAGVDITFDDPGSGKSLKGDVKVVLATQAGTDYYFIMTFAAPVDQYDLNALAGAFMEASLHVAP